MTETQREHEARSAGTGGTPAQAQESTVYNYASAGITEREGRVPIWLWVVAISLLIWGIYYLVAYWNAPVTPT